MTAVLELIDRAKLACKADTEAELAKCLKITPQALSNYRHGVSLPDTVVCGRLAELTGESIARVLGMIGEARAKTADEKKVWRRLQQTTAALIIGLLAPYPAHAEPVSKGFSALSVYYVKFRRWLGQVNFSYAG